MQYVAFTDLDRDGPYRQPGHEKIGCGGHLFRLPQGALPYSCHAPPVFDEFCANGAVSSDVRIELRPPELWPGCRDGRVAAPLVSVPEAAMHEDHGAVLRKNKVRSTVNLGGMKPEAETARVQCPPESQLRLCILSPHGGHHPRTGYLIDIIRCGLQCSCLREVMHKNLNQRRENSPWQTGKQRLMQRDGCWTASPRIASASVQTPLGHVPAELRR